MMKKIAMAAAVGAALMAWSCSGSKSTTETGALAHIDWNTEFEEEEIDWEKYADFEYVPLETTDESLFNNGFSFGINDSLVVVADLISGKFLVYDRQGRFRNSIEHKGNGPEEYVHIGLAAVNMDKGEVYIQDLATSKLLTYGLDDTFKNCVELPFKQYTFFDGVNLCGDKVLVYQTKDLRLSPLENNDMDERYMLLDPATGEVVKVPLVEKHPVGNSEIFDLGNNTTRSVALRMDNVVRSNDGLIISDYAQDTIYELVDGKLNPIAVSSNIGREPGRIPDRLSLNYASGRYVFFDYVSISGVNTEGAEFNDERCGNFVLDRKTGEVKKVRMQAPYLKKTDSEEGIRPRTTSGPANLHCFCLRVEKLKEWQEQGVLNPELEEMVSALDEEDNPVLVIAKFKE